jgi:hypothetical protein
MKVTNRNNLQCQKHDLGPNQNDQSMTAEIALIRCEKNEGQSKLNYKSKNASPSQNLNDAYCRC